jgi:hypothetical protein
MLEKRTWLMGNLRTMVEVDIHELFELILAGREK